ncbi:MAG: xylulokinase [Spirochaetota bacterium]
MGRDILMGIDIGTTGCKTVLVDGSGAVLASALEEYPFYSPRHGWAEQEPSDWWDAVVRTIRHLVSSQRQLIADLRGIGLSGQMHGLVALDEHGGVLRPAILWNDQRTGKQCDQVYEAVGGIPGLLSYTNNRMLPGYTGGKILWVREQEPEVYGRMRRFLNPKDYIRFRLTGEYATEVSDASGTGLFDVRSRTWSEPLFEKLTIPLEWAPECRESIEVSGTVSAEATRCTGLPEGLPVVGGGGDSVIQTLGTGVVRPDVLMTTIGTAGIVSTALEEFTPNPDGMLQVFCNVIPSTWHAMGVTLAAGGSMRWAREALGHAEGEVAGLCGEDVYGLISREAAQSPPGANGLIFLPYLQGERCPHTDPDARGVFVGLSHGTRKSDIFRSVMEGVMFSFRDVASIFSGLGMDFEHIATSGGGAQSDLWRQIHADIFKKRVVTLSGSREGAAYGAVMVAGVGLGIWDGFEHVCALLNTETANEPDSEHYALYDHYFSIYQSLYGLLAESFKKINQGMRT